MAQTWREMIALKAVAEPILMRERRAVMTQVKMMALAGICFLSWTWPIQFEKGRPLSRAKANVWRAVDALKETFAAITIMRVIIVKPLTPVVLTAVLKT